MMLRYTKADARNAMDEWGFNCGPGALTAVLDMTPDEIRPFLGDFESKGYVSPKMMLATLDMVGVDYKLVTGKFPDWGLVRVMWGGPWSGVAAERHTHWIGSCWRDEKLFVYDSNAVQWMPFEFWRVTLVPWLLAEAEPESDGTWKVTHAIEVKNE
jgi:hypothetical protein